MNKLIITGNLGADARLITPAGGKPFISFSIAESSDPDRTIWVECTLSVKDPKPKILEYLKKAKKVVVSGRAYAKVFNSANGPVPQLAMFVDELDLC